MVDSEGCASSWENALIYSILEGVKGIWGVVFEPMYGNVASITYPNTLTKIGIIPMVVNKSHRAVAQLALAILWIWAFARSGNICSILPQTVFSHIIPARFAHSVGIALAVLVVLLQLARLAVSIISTGGTSIFGKLFNWVSGKATSARLYAICNNFRPSLIITQFGTVFPPSGVRGGYIKLFSAVRAISFHTSIVPYTLQNCKRCVL